MPAPFLELPVNNDSESIIGNITANLGRGLPMLRGLAEVQSKPIAIVGGGPSLAKYLPILQAIRNDVHILAVNGSYGYLKDKGIIPDRFVLIDSREQNLPLVADPCEMTRHYLATQVHPSVVDALKGYNVTLFNLGTRAAHDAHKRLGIKDITALTAPVGMASVHAVYLAATLGYRTVMLFGYDFSHAEGSSYAFDHPLDTGEWIEVYIDGKTFRTTLALARTAEQFFRAINPLVQPPCELDVRLYSDGLLRAVLQHQLSVPAEQSERKKYEAMWSLPVYRKVAPGLESVDEAVELLGAQPGESIADFGCGTGRCVSAFIAKKLDGIGVDIASNALEESVPFVLASLWDAALLPSVDYGFSCDVLEHIPTAKVDETLAAIHGAVRKGCYLNIDTIPDSMGVLIGQTLHETVRPGEWWEAKLKAVWPSVQRIRPDDPRQAIFVCKRTS